MAISNLVKQGSGGTGWEEYNSFNYESENVSIPSGQNIVLLDIQGSGYLRNAYHIASRVGVFKITIDGVVVFNAGYTSGLVQSSELVSSTSTNTLGIRFSGSSVKALSTSNAGVSLPYLGGANNILAYLSQPIFFKNSLKIERSNTESYGDNCQYVINGGLK